MINKRYTSTKKNGGNVPKVEDERKYMVPIPCGNCIECRKKKAAEWRTRLTIELEKHNNKAHFVTLTFDNVKLNDIIKKNETEEANIIAKAAVRGFLERWRAKHGKSVKHWLIPELGHIGTERLHLHGILFTEEDEKEIQARWGLGIATVGYSMNQKVINYMVKYITKEDKDHPGFSGRILASPGIGGSYAERKSNFNKYKEGGRTNKYIIGPNGGKMPMPTYLRNKQWTEEERDKLWTEILDSDRMFVMGREIKNISTPKGGKELQKALEYARWESTRRGFGNGNYRKKEYMVRNSRKKA